MSSTPSPAAPAAPTDIRFDPSPAQLAETAELRVDEHSGAAAGFGAIVSTMAHALPEMGVVRSARTFLKLNQVGGFDCMSCAWPEPTPSERSSAEFCENGAKAVAAEATLRRLTPEFFARYSIAELREQTDHWLESQGRLTTPMLRRAGAEHYEPVTWEAAFALLGEELRAARPSRAAFYTSGRTSNEAAFLYQLFARRYGTNNLPDCSNMCHESSGFALGETLGVGKGTVQLDDFAAAEAIFLIGQNPGTNHPRMLTTLGEAAARGCRIVAVNPLREPGLLRFAHPQHPLNMLTGGTALAELFLQVRINGDVPLLQGIAKAVLEAEAAAPGSVLDHAFIREHTVGFEEYAAEIRAVRWADLVAGSGIAESQMRAAADIYIRAKSVIACWAMGLTQHRNAVGNIREVVNLLLLRGNIGRPGAGVCPVRGHSNVQGDRTMGITELPKPEFLAALQREFGFAPPTEHGLDTVGAIAAMRAGQLDVFFALGGNFLSAAPDTAVTAAALESCRLTAHVSTKLNRSHLHTGRVGLILPTLGRTEIDRQAGGEQFVTVENSMSVVSASRGHNEPASDGLLSEPAIVARLAKAVLGSGTNGNAASADVNWDEMAADYDRIRERIARVVPGFADFNKRVREPGGFVLANAARERRFRTPTGERARFTVNARPDWRLARGRFLMMTIRSHDQFNTTVYGLEDRYRGIHNGRRVVLMSAADIASAGLAAGASVDLIGHFAGVRRVAPAFTVVAYDIPVGCVATYFPEANVLIPADSFAEGSRTPTSKSVEVEVIRSAERSERHG